MVSESQQTKLTDSEIKKIAKIFVKELNNIANKYSASKKQEIKARLDKAVKEVDEGLSDSQRKEKVNKLSKISFKYFHLLPLGFQ